MLSVSEKMGHMLMVGFHGLEAPDHILQWLSEGKIGGVILFARNIATPEQVARLTESCHRAARHPILIAIDQEGGMVARLRDGFTESPGAMALGAAGSQLLASQVSGMLAAEMRALGINWALAPVVDVTHNIDNPSVGTRSLGSDSVSVGRLAIAEVRGFQSAGVAACAKHFPGLGNTPVDTHLALAVITGSVDYLWENDMVPFRKAVEAGVETVMVSHVKFQELDAEYPATLSPVIIQKLLREDIGFTGVTSTDCMEMRAISDNYGAAESAVLAALAGNDIIFFSHTREWQEAAHTALVKAVETGRIPESHIDAAVERIQRLKERYAFTATDLSQIRRPEHLALAQHAARAGMVLLHDQDKLLPLKPDQRIAVVEFASYLDSNVLEHGGLTGFASRLHERAPHITTLALKGDPQDATKNAQTHQLAADCDLLVVATRNAHTIPAQQALAAQLIGAARQSVLLCLRNPYDVDILPGANAVLCTCGDSTPSLQAAVDALMGDFTPTGKLPVPVSMEVP